MDKISTVKNLQAQPTKRKLQIQEDDTKNSPLGPSKEKYQQETFLLYLLIAVMYQNHKSI